MNLDMADPAVNARYSNYLNYLYTLKGRQNTRYGNFLNAAIADYNADVEKTQSNYDTVYKNYSDAMTRQSTIAQNEYNTLYSTMSDLYTNLEQAPTKKANLEALQLQNQANALVTAQNSLDQANGTNPKYLADVKTYSDHITDKDGNLNTAALGAGGLAGFLEEINYQGGDPQAAIKAITMAMATSLTTSPDIKKVDEFRTMLGDLSSVEGGDQISAMISPSLAKASYALVSEYVLGNLGDIKSATKQLVGGRGGLMDKATWLNDHKNLDSGILSNLYDLAQNNITPGSAYEKNPSTFLSAIFQGGDDQAVASNLTSSLMSSW
jgi:hypothetical protein